MGWHQSETWSGFSVDWQPCPPPGPLPRPHPCSGHSPDTVPVCPQGLTAAECLCACALTRLPAPTQVFLDFLWVCIIDDSNSAHWLGWLSIDYSENREPQGARHWPFLWINTQNNAWQRFQWLGYMVSENLTIELNHNRLLIRFYLTHKKKCWVIPGGLDQVGSVMQAVTFPDGWTGEVPYPPLALRRMVTLSPAACDVAAKCVVTSHMNRPIDDHGS